MVPPVTWPVPGSRRMMDSPVVLLPQPDSPTIPTLSPSLTSKVMPSTATTGPVRIRNSVRRFSSCRTGVRISEV